MHKKKKLSDDLKEKEIPLQWTNSTEGGLSYLVSLLGHRNTYYGGFGDLWHQDHGETKNLKTKEPEEKITKSHGTFKGNEVEPEKWHFGSEEEDIRASKNDGWYREQYVFLFIF